MMNKADEVHFMLSRNYLWFLLSHFIKERYFLMKKMLSILLIIIGIYGIQRICAERTPAPLTKADLEKDYDFMWETLEKNYPFFELVYRKYGVNRKNMYSFYKQKLDALETCEVEVFYDFLTNCLNEFRFVGHLSVCDVETYNIFMDCYTDGPFARVLNSPEVVNTYEKMAAGKEKTPEDSNSKTDKPDSVFRLKYYEDVPVIELNSFYCTTEEEEEMKAQKVSELLKKCADSENIIIDLRHNPGGSTVVWEDGILPYLGRNEFTITAYSACINGEVNQTMFPINFETEKEYIQNQYVKYEVETYPISEIEKLSDLSGLPMEELNVLDFERFDFLIKTRMQFNMDYSENWKIKGKLWILVDSRTASAAIDMAYFFQRAGLATIVGPNQAGRVGGVILPPSHVCFSLPNSGILIQYNPYYILNPDGTCTELGMCPDIVVNDPVVFE